MRTILKGEEEEGRERKKKMREEEKGKETWKQGSIRG